MPDCYLCIAGQSAPGPNKIRDRAFAVPKRPVASREDVLNKAGMYKADLDSSAMTLSHKNLASFSSSHISSLSLHSSRFQPSPSSQSVLSMKDLCVGGSDASWGKKGLSQMSASKEMWVDKHRPQNDGQLAVHHKKLEALEQWLRMQYEKLRKGDPWVQRVLVFWGPCGAGKSAAVDVIAQKLGFEQVHVRHYTRHAICGSQVRTHVHNRAHERARTHQSQPVF